LDEILEKTPNLTADIVSDILKSLNYTHTKPLMIYYRMSYDAEDQLKKPAENRRFSRHQKFEEFLKASIIDSDEDITGFNDEYRFNNVHNSGKIWHKKAKKNIIIVNP